MKLNRDQKERYQRQTILAQVGDVGQLNLLAARVLIVGLGGLGAPVAAYLAAAGVGTLGLVDADVVDMSNLQRQVLFAQSQVGQAKVQAARTRLVGLNPGVKINMHKVFIDHKNAEVIAADYDLIVDCSDNFAARYAINDACLAQGKAFVFGSLYRFEGQVSLFCAGDASPCYRCFHPEQAAPPIPNCAEAGILGSLAGVIGSLQATEAIKYLLAAGDSLAGRVLLYDGLSMRFTNMALPVVPDCLCQNPKLLEQRASADDIATILAERAEETNIAELDSPSLSRASRGTGGIKIETTIRETVVTAAQLAQILDENEFGVELIDVREVKENRAMRLRNSLLIPLGALIDRVDEIEGDRPIVVYCRSGTRSRKACSMLRDCGFTDVRNLAGGIMGWYREYEEKNIESDAPLDSI